MSENRNIDSFCVALIEQGVPYDQILAEVKQHFPEAKTKKASLYWYKSRLNRGLFTVENTGQGIEVKKRGVHGAAVSANPRGGTVTYDGTTVPDGLEEIRADLPLLIGMIARTARWVHPDTFRALPVWYPETARGRSLYAASWDRTYSIKNRVTETVSESKETNVKAGKALLGALGVKKKDNWAVCHIWGTDDPKFQRSNRVVRDPRYYTCVGNMVWLPAPLKGLTDGIPEIKALLRFCAFHLYGWTCEHPDVAAQAAALRSAPPPAHYPDHWPHADRPVVPQGTMPFTDRVRASIDKRKSELRRLLADPNLAGFPREEVGNILEFWKIAL